MTKDKLSRPIFSRQGEGKMKTLTLALLITLVPVAAAQDKLSDEILMTLAHLHKMRADIHVESYLDIEHIERLNAEISTYQVWHSRALAAEALQLRPGDYVMVVKQYNGSSEYVGQLLRVDAVDGLSAACSRWAAEGVVPVTIELMEVEIKKLNHQPEDR